MIKNDQFIEYTQYNNNYYGTSKGELERTKSDVVLINLDINIRVRYKGRD